MTETSPITLEIPPDMGGLRLDQALQRLLPQQSRARLQSWIKDGLVTIDARAATPKLRLRGGETVRVVPQPPPQAHAFEAEDIALDVVYEDAELLVINKPAGMVVHPAAGNWSGTLLNALLHYAPRLRELPRAGIVHRLDKDTSGLLVVARTDAAQQHLVRQLQARTVKREYRAVVWGNVWRDGTVDQPVGRHPHARTRMAVTRMGRSAITHYQVLERFAVHSYLRCLLETGRTHQIRVHMQYLKAPLVGDPVYGLRGIMPRNAMSPALRDAVTGFGRQALHAVRLGLLHPRSGAPMEWQVALPDDMKKLLEAMRAERGAANAESTLEFAADEACEDAVDSIDAEEIGDEDETFE